jgi:hypothetical protein
MVSEVPCRSILEIARMTVGIAEFDFVTQPYLPASAVSENARSSVPPASGWKSLRPSIL